ncbi:MAG: hypothetical protein RR075_04445, partial [Pygmaiobacter sp.]
MKALIEKLWPTVTGEIGQKLKNAEISAVVVDRATNGLTLNVKTAERLASEECNALACSVRELFDGFCVTVTNEVFCTQLDKASLLRFTEELKDQGLPINGFLQDCDIEICGSTVTMNVKHGDALLHSIGFEQKL